MTTTRRELLRLGLGGSTLLACGATVPSFLARSAMAMAMAEGHDRGDGRRILVVVQLDGGNDGLNTVVPHGDDVYHKSRPKLAIKTATLKPIDDHIGLHPSLGGFAALRDEGRLAIVQSVGYPNPNRSHFESMATWHTARLDPGQEEAGWLARALDAGPAAGGGGGDAPALHIASEALPQALRGGRQHVPSLARVEQFRRRLGVPGPAGPDDQRAALDRIAGWGEAAENPLLQFVTRSTVVSCASAARLESVLRDEDSGGQYPDNGLAGRLRLIARLIRAGLSTPIYYTQLGGFDTHAEQLSTHAGRLGELSSSVRAFLTDLDRTGDGDRVAILIFSEFGRRLRENASEGTDHGAAAPVFLLGKPVQGGLIGPYPDLTRLKDGDPEHAIDFRRVYATILEQWLNRPAALVLGASFEPLPLFRS